MSKRNNLIIGITSVAAIGLIIFLVKTIKDELLMERLDKIADEGYETAGDILYPTKKLEPKSKSGDLADYSTNNVIFV